MRTDPKKACANEHEKALWAAVHDLIAHPIMVLFWYRGWTLRFHDWTSHKAWSRPKSRVKDMQMHGLVMVFHEYGNIYSCHHWIRDHVLRVQARSSADAAMKAYQEFEAQARHEGIMA